MKKRGEKPETKELVELSSEELEAVSGGRDGKNRPPRTGNRPR